MPYSTQLWLGDLPSGAFDIIYTVPANFTAVVRDMRIRNGYTTSQLSNIQVEGPGSATVVIWQEESFPTSQLDEWQGRVVVPAGLSLWGYSDHGSVTVVISGYLLSDP